MADRLVLAFFWLARLHWLGGRAALQNLPTRFCIGADDHAALLVAVQRLDRELTEVMRLGLEVWIVAIEPVHASMRLEVGLLQETPEAGATHGLQPMRRECRVQVVKTPPSGGTMQRGRFPGCHRQPLNSRRGGKRAAGDPSAGHPAGR